MDVTIIKADGTCERLTDCERKMAVFCAIDAYVAYDVSGRPTEGEENKITEKQIHAANLAMRARTSKEAWVGLCQGELAELKALDKDLDLIALPDGLWDGEVEPKLKCLYGKVLTRHKGIGAASATKVLHLMRPRLIAIADSLVAAHLGASHASYSECALAVARLVRRSGRVAGNADALAGIQQYLREVGVLVENVVPSACRILDALVWMRASVERKTSHYDRLWRLMDLGEP